MATGQQGEGRREAYLEVATTEENDGQRRPAVEECSGGTATGGREAERELRREERFREGE